jgi:hypothetical protein
MPVMKYEKSTNNKEHDETGSDPKHMDVSYLAVS